MVNKVFDIEETLEASILIDDAVLDKNKETMEKMLLDVLLRQTYQKRLQPLGIKFFRRGKKYIGEIEAFGMKEYEFEDIIMNEMVYNWKERYNFLWEQSKDTPQA